MSGPKKEESELKIPEVRMLENNAIQTRFTWGVVFVALVTVLVGLLTMIKPYTSKNPLFNYTISSIYVVFAIVMGYTFYAICRTSWIIDKLIKEQEYKNKAIKDFLETNWKVSYSVLFSEEKKENEKVIIYFKEKTVIFLSIVVIGASVLPLLFKLDFEVVVSGLIVLIVLIIGALAFGIIMRMLTKKTKKTSQ